MTETEIQRLVVRMVGDSSSFKGMISDAQRQVASLDRTVGGSTKAAESFGYSLTSLTGVIASATTALAGIGFAVGTLADGLKRAGMFEQTTISFETMLGSAEQTKKLLEDLTTFAAKTPFEMPEIEQAARGLVQFGERGEELMETLNLLGNAASGTSTPFGMVALIFNQIRGVGKLLTQDFRQLSTRGILSLQDIANYYGKLQGHIVSTAEAQQMLSKGMVSFEDLKGVFRDLSKEGGRFANLMERQSTSLEGLKSTLSDAYGIAKRNIGEGIVPLAKAWIGQQIKIVDSVREWITNNKELAGSIAVTTTAVLSLAAGVVGVGMAARFMGISFQKALMGTGIGALLLVLGVGLGVLVNKFKLMDKIAGVINKVGDNFHYITRALRTTGILLNDLWSSVSTFFVEVWKGSIIIVKEQFGGFFESVREWISPIQTWFKNAFQNIVANLDVMFGSWQGFGDGVVHIWDQTTYAFKAAWETAVYTVAKGLLTLKGSFTDWGLSVIASMNNTAMPYFSRFFIWLQKKAAEMRGEKWLMTPKEEAKIISDVQKQMMKGLNKDVLDAKTNNDSALESLETEHQRRMESIGRSSLDESAEWEKRRKDATKFSDRVKEAWEKAKEAAGVANSSATDGTKTTKDSVDEVIKSVKELKKEIGVEAVSWDSSEVVNAQMMSSRTKPTVAQSQSGYTANEEALIGLRGTLRKLDRNRVRRSLQNPQVNDFTGGHALPTPIPTPDDAMGELHPSMQFPTSEGELALVGLMEKLVEISQKQLDKTPEFESAGLGAGS